MKKRKRPFPELPTPKMIEQHLDLDMMCVWQSFFLEAAFEIVKIPRSQKVFDINDLAHISTVSFMHGVATQLARSYNQ